MKRKPIKDRCCMNAECPLHGQFGKGNISKHSFYNTSQGRRRRYFCNNCKKTFSSTAGTPSHQAYDAARLLRTIGRNMEGKIHSTSLCLDNQLMHMSRFQVRLKEKVKTKTVLGGFYGDPLMSVSYLNSMNLVFSKGRDHGFYGRIFNQSVVVRDSIEVSTDGCMVYGTCFSPQDGNSLLTSVAVTLWFLDPKTWQEKMSVFSDYLHRFRTIPA